MSEWNELAHFLYGRGFWYADPVREAHGLTEPHLLWVPNPKSLCILWEVGHIAHRERIHVGGFLEGLPLEGLIPPGYDVFGPDWCSVADMRAAIASPQAVLDWVRSVRDRSHRFISSLSDSDFHKPAAHSDEPLSVAHWLFITTAHTALHIGRLQLLRALIEGTEERAC